MGREVWPIGIELNVARLRSVPRHNPPTIREVITDPEMVTLRTHSARSSYRRYKQYLAMRWNSPGSIESPEGSVRFT